MIRLFLVVGLLVGCKNGKTEPPAPDPAPVAPTEAPAPPAPPPPPPAAPADPKALYAECRDRMEKPETAGECKADADCAVTGCGKEVCTTAKGAGDVMTTCENKPCFLVVENCGCHEGACTWNVKAEAPAMPAPLPRSLPSSGPPPAPAPAP
jgi:eight-cysteine-cluster-containing protein